VQLRERCRSNNIGTYERYGILGSCGFPSHPRARLQTQSCVMQNERPIVTQNCAWSGSSRGIRGEARIRRETYSCLALGREITREIRDSLAYSQSGVRHVRFPGRTRLSKFVSDPRGESRSSRNDEETIALSVLQTVARSFTEEACGMGLIMLKDRGISQRRYLPLPN
jgi:hypothetical protein